MTLRARARARARWRCVRHLLAPLRVVLACSLALAACSVDGLAFRQDNRLQVSAPDDRSVVTVPFEVHWTLDDQRDDELLFAVLVDRFPPRPGQSIEALLPEELRRPERCDEDCRVDALLARNVFITDEWSVAVTRLVRRHGVSEEQRRRHEVSVIVLDAELRRVGEVVAWIEFDEAAR